MILYGVCELRQVSENVRRSGDRAGTVYYVAHLEDETGNSFNVTSDEKAVFSGFKKGDAVLAKIDAYLGRDWSRLTLLQLVKLESLEEPLIDFSPVRASELV